jgi:hypothetical protein
MKGKMAAHLHHYFNKVSSQPQAWTVLTPGERTPVFSRQDADCLRSRDILDNMKQSEISHASTPSPSGGIDIKTNFSPYPHQ